LFLISELKDLTHDVGVKVMDLFKRLKTDVELDVYIKAVQEFSRKTYGLNPKHDDDDEDSNQQQPMDDDTKDSTQQQPMDDDDENLAGIA
jgi:hypothetical protein